MMYVKDCRKERSTEVVPGKNNANETNSNGLSQLKTVPYFVVNII